jgi:D-alanyl-lipoteichoic acid acyltransferase DltB (MBOAT superfamily)
VNYNSWAFWLLFAAVFIPYWRLGHGGQNALLLVASYVFYGFWDYRFLFLILISTVIDFIGGLGVAGVRLSAGRLAALGGLIIGSAFLLCTPIDYRLLAEAALAGNAAGLAEALPQSMGDCWIVMATAAVTLAYGAALPFLYRLPDAVRRRTFLTISMVANLAILGFFKYCDFFLISLKDLLDAIGWPMSISTLGIILPAGISFYTFQAMSYTIDIYRGEAEPTDRFGDFALFVCFFPHLVAGPIMRAHTLLPQVVGRRTLQPGAIEEGLYLVVMGLFKKLVVADNLAPIAALVFGRFARAGEAMSTQDTLGGFEVLVGVYAFAFQIYGDFSGYSSIARGISKWLGYELVINFDNPYLAVNPSDFWRRWHISLSSWLRDYLYIALGGNRSGTFGTYRNLMLTMLLGGLWHGANWTFIAWGLYHGVLLCVFRVVPGGDPKPSGGPWQSLRWLVSVVLMFQLTCVGWLLFRADSIAVCGRMIAALLGEWHASSLALGGLAMIAFYAGPMFLWECLFGSEKRLPLLRTRSWLLAAGLMTYLVVMLLLFCAEKSSEFIYFQF